MEIRASERARRYVRKRGGVVFVWLDDNGMLSYATSQPAVNVSFRRLSAPGFSLLLDKRALLGDWIGFERSPLPPWRSVVAFDLQHGA